MRDDHTAVVSKWIKLKELNIQIKFNGWQMQAEYTCKENL